MMAANAIKPPKTGGVRHPCLFCDSRGYSARENKEQRELLDLMSETDYLRQGNYRRERKLRKLENEMKQVALMNLEMEDFFNHVHIDAEKSSIDIGTQTEEEKVNQDKLAKEKKIWRRKEEKVAKDLESLRAKLNENSTPEKPSKPIHPEMWGHQTRRWLKGQPTLRSAPAPPVSTFLSNKSRRKSSNPNLSKPYSIPFRPKPLHLMVRKAYLKPPPRLPPPAQFQAPQLIQQSGCAGMQCATPVNIEARELFADALERAVSSEYGAVADEHWADHPFYGDLDSPEPCNDAEHLCYDDLDSPETVYDDVEEMHESRNGPHHAEESVGNGDDMPEYVDFPQHEEPDGDEMPACEDNPHHEEGSVCEGDEMLEKEEPDDVPWEDHPYYDTPDEAEECPAESDDIDAVACQDNSSCSEEDEVVWEDSPYY